MFQNSMRLAGPRAAFLADFNKLTAFDRKTAENAIKLRAVLYKKSEVTRAGSVYAIAGA
jgi:hypothetical protein